MHVLFVDDNPLMQQVVSRFLVSQGYSVAVAQTGEEAIAMARNEPFQLFLIDMHLPDQDGPELLGTLRQEHGITGCPAIAVSGLGEDDREKTVVAGFDWFLAKPIDLDELLESVRRHVGPQMRAVGM